MAVLLLLQVVMPQSLQIAMEKRSFKNGKVTTITTSREGVTRTTTQTFSGRKSLWDIDLGDGRIHKQLRDDNRCYLRTEGNLSVSIATKRDVLEVPEAAYLGTCAGHGRDFRTDLVFTSWVQEGNVIVGTRDNGRTVRWVLDDDYNVVESARYRADGSLVYRAENTLGHDGFPIAIRIFDSKGLRYELEIQSKFNYDMDTSKFVPATIGIGLGNKLRDVEAAKSYGWVDNQLMPYREMKRKITSGELKVDEIFEKTLEHARYLTDVVVSNKDEWKSWTARTIKYYHFTEAQANKAWSIYREAKIAVKRPKNEMTKVIHRVNAKIRALPLDENRLAKAKELREELEEVRGSVQAIFNLQLKKRVLALRTREQLKR